MSIVRDRPVSSALICDFCSSPEVVQAYMAEDFTALEIREAENRTRFNSLGAWAACRECAALIEAEGWEALLERSLRTFLASMPPELVLQPEQKGEIRRLLGEAQEQFRKLRKKPV